MNEIERLKRCVVQSKELSEPLDYFFDLTDANVFSKIKSHRPIKNINEKTEMLQVIQLIQKVVNERLGKSIKQLTPIFHEIPEHYFIHGVCISVDLIVPLAVIYFSDIKTGIFATVGSQTDIMRFSLIDYSDRTAVH